MERAKKYADDIAITEERGWMDRSDIYEIAKDAHIAGATEQRKIDIDKACEWFANYLGEIGYPDDWLRDSPNMTSGEQRFRKAMED